MSDTDATPTGDPLIAQSEEATLEARKVTRAADLFDLRRLIGGLFVIYGVILLVLGIGASDAEIDKSAGWNLNLWVGLAMLVVGGLFLLWGFLRPLSQQLDDTPPAGERSVTGPPAPTGPDAAALGGSETTSRRAGRDPDRTDR